MLLRYGANFGDNLFPSLETEIKVGRGLLLIQVTFPASNTARTSLLPVNHSPVLPCVSSSYHTSHNHTYMHTHTHACTCTLTYTYMHKHIHTHTQLLQMHHSTLSAFPGSAQLLLLSYPSAHWPSAPLPEPLSLCLCSVFHPEDSYSTPLARWSWHLGFPFSLTARADLFFI